MAVAARERSVLPPIDQMSPIDLVRNNIETKRTEVVPVARISIDGSVVDETHARDLGNSMQMKREQLQPISVRARIDEDDGEIIYDVVDGFHRVHGSKLTDKPEIDAVVLYACDDEELADLRVLAVSSVQSVQFARLANWIQQSWDSSEFADSGLTVVQAFQSVVFDTNKSRIARDLSVERLAEIKEWVRRKSERWSRSVAGTWTILRTVSLADPDLVTQVRSSSGGVKDRIGHITPSRLTLVVDAFPGEENFTIQRELLNVITENRLYAEEAQILTDAVKGEVLPHQPADIVRSVIESELFKHVTRRSEQSPKKRYASKNKDNVHTLKERIAALEEQLREVKASAREGGGGVAWWRGADYLSREEIILMERVMYNGESLPVIARGLNLSTDKGIAYIRSAFAKWHREARPEDMD